MDKVVRLASPLQQDSIVDGPGIRCVLWTQGCPHACVGCHNPQTHAIEAGIQVSVSEILGQLKEMRLQNGITFSGGEPFLQTDALVDIADYAKELNWNIWAYSGFTFEEILKNDHMKNLLVKLDILVDGTFVQEQKDYRLKFKGSKNQRIIDVQASLQHKKVILSSYDEVNQNL